MVALYTQQNKFPTGATAGEGEGERERRILRARNTGKSMKGTGLNGGATTAQSRIQLEFREFTE